MTERSEEAPLLIQEPLVAVKPKRDLRRPFHWFLLILSFAIGITPVIAGFVFGAAGIISVMRFEGMPFWAAVLGAATIISCIVGVIVIAYGFAEANDEASWLGFFFALLAWPGIAMAALLLTITAPDVKSSEESSVYAVTIEDLI